MIENKKPVILFALLYGSGTYIYHPKGRTQIGVLEMGA
jgi:hypothetical protein